MELNYKESENMQIRLSGMEDMPVILAIYEDARNFMRQTGNPDQWGDGHPAIDVIKNDIKAGNSYVVEENGQVIGTFAFILGEDPTYARIENGAWLNQNPYGTIHRLASFHEVHGVAQLCFDWCKSQIEDIRIDTHKDNRVMQHVLEKNGFVYCGIIYVEDGSQRIAYQFTKKKRIFHADRVSSYFKAEWKVLLIVTISGLIYNIGLLAGPLFEGKMAGCLADIIGGKASFSMMLSIVLCYVLSIATVQTSRYIKRFYVRRFANNVNRRMKKNLYGSLVQKSRAELLEEGEGAVMTKAIQDVDDCVEGMRKFTTEIFDTGVALTAYTGMLLWYDWHLALLCLIFPPVAYFIAEKMKIMIQRTGTVYKKQSAELNTATLDRARNAVTYRVFGCETERKAAYEENLTAYEKAAVKANIWNAVMPPVYRVISMTGVLFILYFGQKNVMGTGWSVWNIAAFTTFLSCFVKLAKKTSSVAKLFNSIHKAQISWNRIKPILAQKEEWDQETAQESKLPTVDNSSEKENPVERIRVRHLYFAYPGGKRILRDISFEAKKGQMIGITGAVACGKSTLGKVFLCEYPYEGEILIDGVELRNLSGKERTAKIGYLGHDPELFFDSISENILMGKKDSAETFLEKVCMEEEVASMTDKENTKIGDGGVRLSGGQAKRLAFARTLCHKKPVLILDDPFSALDKDTEKQIFENLKQKAKENIVLLISHRLYLFPEMDQVLWMDNSGITKGTHEELLEKVPEYRNLYRKGMGSAD